MLFKMILDGASDDERHIARGFLKHIVAGFGAGLLFAGVMIALLFLMMGQLDLNVPVIFIAAMLLQFGPIGGLIGAGVYVTRIADRPKTRDEDDDDDKPGGGTRAPVTQGAFKPVRLRPKAFPVPSRA
ncbi:MAG: hypothetical protein R3C13_09755 [Hyphomonas sp.]|uniref:hypothetical protein n=1 Tax=Hyphomonas sp. TaxID=87 RepID=UPI00352756EA